MATGAENGFAVLKVLVKGGQDLVTVVAAGITIYEALKAYGELKGAGIALRVIDAYSIKPIDSATLRVALAETGLIVTVEDHWAEGGLGDAVLEGLADAGPIQGSIVRLAVREVPGSATPEQLRAWAGIDADAIATAVREHAG